MNDLHPAGSAGCFLSLHNGKKCAKLEKNKRRVRNGNGGVLCALPAGKAEIGVQ